MVSRDFICVFCADIFEEKYRNLEEMLCFLVYYYNVVCMLKKIKKKKKLFIFRLLKMNFNFDRNIKWICQSVLMLNPTYRLVLFEISLHTHV